jgi:four helix bundle protein
MQDFRNLEVWKRAHELVIGTYGCTARFPSEERFGLAHQLRRCAMSVASNIAEGSARPSDRDFARFLGMALASASEAEYQLLLAHDLGYVERDHHESLSRAVVTVRKMLIRLRQRLAHSS